MLQDIMTVFWRDWLVLKRRLVKFIFARMVTPMLYLIAFGWGLGKNINVQSGSYLDFLVPGILALNSMNISFSGVALPLHTSRVYHKTLEEYLVAPIKSISFIIGKLLSGVLRGLISSVIIIIMAYLFGASFVINLKFVMVLVLNCLIFSAVGFIAALLIDAHEDMGNFNTYILLPMSFLCGTFFSTEKLPQIIHYFLELLPLTHASNALRVLGSNGEITIFPVAVLVIYAIGLSMTCWWCMENFKK